jgi:hypothetical protein
MWRNTPRRLEQQMTILELAMIAVWRDCDHRGAIDRNSA